MVEIKQNHPQTFQALNLFLNNGKSLNFNGNKQKLNNCIEHRLYNTSRLILSSQSVILNQTLVLDENDDPWKVISQLRQDFDTLTADKENQLGQLKSVMEETKGLPDEIAQLEAELNITKAELQVTQLLVNEASSSSSSTNNLCYAK